MKMTCFLKDYVASIFAFFLQVHHLCRGREQMKKATKNDIRRRTCSQKNDAAHTNSLLYFFLHLNLSLLVSHEALITLQQARRKTHSRTYRGKVKHELRVTSSNPRVASSNSIVRTLKAPVARLKARVGRLKARVGRLKSRVRRLKARVEAMKPRGRQ